MKYIERPEIHVLRGERAIVALKDYIDELNENNPEDLTKTQTKAMIKLAQSLISTINSKKDKSNNGKHSFNLPNLKSRLQDLFFQMRQRSDSITLEAQNSPFFLDEYILTRQQIK